VEALNGRKKDAVPMNADFGQLKAYLLENR